MSSIRYRFHRLLALSLSLALGFMALGSFFYVSADREDPIIQASVQVGPLDITDKTYAAAAEEIEAYSEMLLNRPIALIYEDKQYMVPASDLGISVDTFRTVEQVFEAYNIATPVKFATNVLKPLIGPKKFTPIISTNKDDIYRKVRSHIPALTGKEFTVMPKGEATVNWSQWLQSKLFGEETLALAVTVAVAEDEAVIVASEDETDPVSREKNTSESDSESENTSETEINDPLTPANISVEEPFTFTYAAQNYTHVVRFTRDWIDYSRQVDGKYRLIKANKMRDYLRTYVAEQFYIPRENGVLKSIPQSGQRVTVEGTAKDGQALDINKTTAAFYAALSSGQHTAELAVTSLPGQIINETGQDLGQLSLIGYGYSNFETSAQGRAHNVRKGLSENFNNILLAPGEVFSHNALVSSISTAAGWQYALGIFGGGTVSPTIGGGICQTTTTGFRAALYSGLEIVERAPHSLYVHYYARGNQGAGGERSGDGLDATVWKPSRDFKFKNDTGSYVLLQSYTDGFDAYVKVYGTPDGRKVDMFGPYYHDSVPAEFSHLLSLGRSQIGWVQRITRADGSIQENKILSTYNRGVPAR